MTLFKKPTVAFQNDGLLDLRAVTTMGVSVKENENPIGLFGTGLKYACAVLAREGQELSIFLGEEEHVLYTKKEIIRGKDFDVVYLGEQSLGFTTHYGLNWTLREAYRELASNTMDEDGIIEQEELTPTEGKTTILVRGKKFLEQGAGKHGEIFLPDLPKLSESGGITLHNPSGLTKGIYYRGIQVHKSSEQENFLFCYNFTKEVRLTEDRTLADISLRMWDIVETLGMVDDKGLAKKIVSAGKDTIEGILDYQFVSIFSPTFIEVAKKRIAQRGTYMNPSLRRKIKALFPEVDKVELVEELSHVEELSLARAIEVCTRIGYPVGDYPVRVAKDMGNGVHGLAKDGIIYLDRKAFSKGTKWIVSTLMEEWIHLKTGFGDETRELQQYLFDKLLDLLEEAVLKEPI